MRLRQWVIGLLVILAAAGLAAGWRFIRSRPLVETVHPQRREVVELVIASGRLRAVRQSALGAEVAGVVEQVLVDEGDRVRAGQPLVRLRRQDAEQRVEQARLAVATAEKELGRLRAGAAPEEIRRAAAELEQADAALEQAEREHTRARMLWERGLIARAELDRAETGLEQARAARRVAEQAGQVLRSQPRPEDVQVAQARLREAGAALRAAEVEAGKRAVTAPFAGLVVHRSVEPGQGVAPGTPLLTVADMSRTELLVETDENNLARLRVGQRAIVIAPAYAAQSFAAVLRQIGPEVDSQRGVVALRLDPAALPPFARPDMTVDVNIEVARVPDALSVPATSVLERGGKSYVLTVQDGRAALADVRVRGRNPDWAAVEGLAAEARVIVRATEVTPGQTVRARDGGP
ncbi:MAG: efflux RND transporter periplasmic adaptor subunit [Candidatus Rokubacteria bacterium]|nr:efflux RND transporter periplasmic adaptor subunit [Candidatus Rokubacteria bacterium]